MLIRSMSALDPPPPPPPLLSALTTVWKQMGLREGAHMPSMLCLANGSVMAGSWSDVSLPLYSACCFHAAAVKAGGGAVPAASCRTLGVAAAEETGRRRVSLSVI